MEDCIDEPFVCILRMFMYNFFIGSKEDDHETSSNSPFESPG
jgi:hypothetical protein